MMMLQCSYTTYCIITLYRYVVHIDDDTGTLSLTGITSLRSGMIIHSHGYPFDVTSAKPTGLLLRLQMQTY